MCFSLAVLILNISYINNTIDLFSFAEPCTVSNEDMEAHHILLADGDSRKIYLQHGDFVTFACRSGRAVSEVDLNRVC